MTHNPAALPGLRMANLTTVISGGQPHDLEQALRGLTEERLGILETLIEAAEAASARGDAGHAAAAAGLVLLGEHLRAASFRHSGRARALLPLHVLAPSPQTPEELLHAAAATLCEAYGTWPRDQRAALHDRVQDWLGSVRALPALQLPADLVLLWACALGEWCERHGDVGRFESLAAVVAEAEVDAHASPWLRAHWCLVNAWQLQAFGRTQPADAALQRAAQLAHDAGLRALEAMVWLQHARLTLWRTDSGRAREIAARAASRGDARETPVWLADQADVECRLALRAGDHAQALVHARRANALLQLADAPPSYDATYRVNQAYALIGVGSFEQANELFAALQASPLPPFLAARVQVLQALALLTSEHSLGRWTAASEGRLARAMYQLRELEWPNVFTFLPQQIAGLFARALAQGIERAWICQAIQSRRLAPPPTADESWPWPVRVRVLGVFACDVNGTPLTGDGAKAASRPLALLRRLAVQAGHEGIQADVLARGLWPGEGREGRAKVLETTLARLRKLLGVPDAIQLHDHRLRLNPVLVWIDASMFVQVIDRIDGRRPQDAAWRHVFTLYRGPLLADEPEPWARPWCDRLRALLAAALLTARHLPGDDERWLRATAADPAVASLRPDRSSGPDPGA